MSPTPPGLTDRRICLDSWAVLRWLEGTEPAASRVDEVLGADRHGSARTAPATRPVMSWVNVGEVAYVTQRTSGAGTSAAIVRDLRGLLDLDEATPARVLAAAAIKATHAMALGDSYAAATAEAHDAVLWTGDPELLGDDRAWLVEDLRTG